MKFFLYFVLFLNLFSCSENSSIDKDVGYRNKSYQNKIHAGSTCKSGCIWSTYAVTNNIQQSSEQCVEGPCACVQLGNANNSCVIESDATVSSGITQLYEPNEIKNIPYYNQFYNEKKGWATCQNTSVAMVLSYFESSIHPDEIYKDWGKDYAQSPSGLNSVYSSYASRSNIITYTNASPEELKAALISGYIVIVHGYFTGYGHVLVVRGYKDGRYYVNDPAGKWAECFKCGYNSTNDLNGVTSYSEAAFDAAVFTSNGYSYLPGWIHLISPL